jgi:hypothetical protein
MIPMETEDFAADAALFARMRAMWQDVDPVPAELVDRMVAAVAVEDLSREYALLTIVSGDLAAVRGETDTATLQFSDGTTSVLVHVTATEDGSRRIDGWVDAAALAIRLSQGEEHGSGRARPVRLRQRAGGRLSPAPGRSRHGWRDARLSNPPIRSVNERMPQPDGAASRCDEERQ